LDILSEEALLCAHEHIRNPQPEPPSECEIIIALAMYIGNLFERARAKDPCASAQQQPCEPHTAAPATYLAWHVWAEKMSKTHRQRRCKGCGLYVIWEPKPGIAPPAKEPS